MPDQVKEIFEEEGSILIPLPLYKRGDVVLHTISGQLGSVIMIRYDYYSREWWYMISMSLDMQSWINQNSLEDYTPDEN